MLFDKLRNIMLRATVDVIQVQMYASIWVAWSNRCRRCGSHQSPASPVVCILPSESRSTRFQVQYARKSGSLNLDDASSIIWIWEISFVRISVDIFQLASIPTDFPIIAETDPHSLMRVLGVRSWTNPPQYFSTTQMLPKLLSPRGATVCAIESSITVIALSTDPKHTASSITVAE